MKYETELAKPYDYVPCDCGRNLTFPQEVRPDRSVVCRCGKPFTGVELVQRKDRPRQLLAKKREKARKTPTAG